MLRTYGLGEENVEVTPEKKNEVAKELFRLIDYDRDGEISLEELKQYYKEGHVLPDFGLGPGHHGDEEYEYEIHHFEKYHSEDSPEEELNHPEDIAHVSLFGYTDVAYCVRLTRDDSSRSMRKRRGAKRKG